MPQKPSAVKSHNATYIEPRVKLHSIGVTNALMSSITLFSAGTRYRTLDKAKRDHRLERIAGGSGEGDWQGMRGNW